MVREIDIDLLVPHPENCNHMDAGTMRKLRRHIERTERYEPLTVRPHPQETGKFQVINGHHRLRVLRALGHGEVLCTVWNLDDDQARLYLATLNRLAGTDVPERRVMLLEDLLERFSVQELSALLPEDEKQLRELEQLARVEPDEPSIPPSGTTYGNAPVILDFMLDAPQAEEVNLALDMVISAEDGRLTRSQALVRLARGYLKRCRVA